MTDLVSVIVPVYKVEKYLSKCADSIINQTYKNLEIILVDDGSPDNSGKMCDEYAKKDSRIKVIHKENGGLSSARNAGCKISTGKYVYFVDSDDFIHEKAIEDLLSNLIKYNADISIGNSIKFTGKERGSFTNKVKIFEKVKLFDCYTDYYSQAIYAWNKLMKAEIAKAHPFPVGKLCEDSFTMHLFFKEANRIVLSSNQYYYYRVNNSASIMNSMMSKNNFDEVLSHLARLKFFKDNNFDFKYIAYTYQLLINILISYQMKHKVLEIKQKSEQLYKQLISEAKTEKFYNQFDFKVKFKMFLFQHCKWLLKLILGND